MCAGHVLAEAKVVCVRRNSNPLCSPAVRGPVCVVLDCAPAGTMFAQNVLPESTIVCVRRKLKSGFDPGINFVLWDGCAAVYVGLYV